MRAQSWGWVHGTGPLGPYRLAGEMTQWVRCLLCKCENLGSDPQSLHKPEWTVCVCVSVIIQPVLIQPDMRQRLENAPKLVEQLS